jgi:CYTH domain-containing protein
MPESSAELEIELAFLATRLPEGLENITPVRIVDFYLSDEPMAKLRLRQKGTTFELTKKVCLDPNDFSQQQEYNTPLTLAEFEKLRTAGGREVVKDRYYLPLDKHTAEVDVFRGQLEGLVLIEFEFKSKAERDAFSPPDFCGADVSQEGFVSGAYLAGKSLGDIQADLDRFHYTAL